MRKRPVRVIPGSEKQRAWKLWKLYSKEMRTASAVFVWQEAVGGEYRGEPNNGTNLIVLIGVLGLEGDIPRLLHFWERAGCT